MASKIALVGAGQIGSRHLQALALADFPVALEVFDPSEASLGVARERFEQITAGPGVESVRYFTSLAELSPNLDLAVVATNSLVRLDVLRKLYSSPARPRNLILEKVLFPSVAELDEAATLIQRTEARAWVNCAKRTYPALGEIRAEMKPGEPVQMAVRGNQWGLACNSIHFVDLLGFLTGEEVEAVNTAGLDAAVLESKRSGYVEFTGTLRVAFTGGSTLELSCRAEGPVSFSLALHQGQRQWEIFESRKEYTYTAPSAAPVVRPFPAPAQSTLTQVFAREILQGGQCSLTSFAQSARYHRPYLQAFLEAYQRARGPRENRVPIT